MYVTFVNWWRVRWPDRLNILIKINFPKLTTSTWYLAWNVVIFINFENLHLKNVTFIVGTDNWLSSPSIISGSFWFCLSLLLNCYFLFVLIVYCLRVTTFLINALQVVQFQVLQVVTLKICISELADGLKQNHAY